MKAQVQTKDHISLQIHAKAMSSCTMVLRLRWETSQDGPTGVCFKTQATCCEFSLRATTWGVLLKKSQHAVKLYQICLSCEEQMVAQSKDSTQ